MASSCRCRRRLLRPGTIRSRLFRPSPCGRRGSWLPLRRCLRPSTGCGAVDRRHDPFVGAIAEVDEEAFVDAAAVAGDRNPRRSPRTGELHRNRPQPRQRQQRPLHRPRQWGERRDHAADLHRDDPVEGRRHRRTGSQDPRLPQGECRSRRDQIVPVRSSGRRQRQLESHLPGLDPRWHDRRRDADRRRRGDVRAFNRDNGRRTEWRWRYHGWGHQGRQWQEARQRQGQGQKRQGRSPRHQDHEGAEENPRDDGQVQVHLHRGRLDVRMQARPRSSSPANRRRPTRS